MSQTSRGTCGTCAYFLDKTFQGKRCSVFPPVPMYNGFKIVHVLPEVHPDDFCSLWSSEFVSGAGPELAPQITSETTEA